MACAGGEGHQHGLKGWGWGKLAIWRFGEGIKSVLDRVKCRQ